MQSFPNTTTASPELPHRQQAGNLLLIVYSAAKWLIHVLLGILTAAAIGSGSTLIIPAQNKIALMSIPLYPLVVANPAQSVGFGLLLLGVVIVASVLVNNPRLKALAQGDGIATPQLASAAVSSASENYQIPIDGALAKPGGSTIMATRTGRLLLVTVLGLVVIIFALIGGGVYFIVKNESSINDAPARAFDSYCKALKGQDYGNAYTLLSSKARQSIAQDAFVSGNDNSLAAFILDEKLLDSQQGIVENCAASTLNVGVTNAHLAVSVSRLTTVHGTLALVYEQDSWRIDSLAPLQTLDITPLAVAANFCTDLVQRDYGDAYQLYSNRGQQLESKDDFVKNWADNLNVNGAPIQFDSCSQLPISYTPPDAQGEASAKIDLMFTIQTTPSVSGTLSLSMTCIQEGGQWKLDDVSSVLQQ